VWAEAINSELRFQKAQYIETYIMLLVSGTREWETKVSNQRTDHRMRPLPGCW